MPDTIPPRPYRFWEVVWDLIPILAVIGGGITIFGEDVARWEDAAGLGISMAMILAVAGASWMQFSTSNTLLWVCRREWRESLALTFLDPREYLLSQLCPRIILQSLSFVPGCCVVVALLVSPLFTNVNLNFEQMVLWATLLYSVLSMQFCGFCVGLLGLTDRIRRLSAPAGNPAFLMLTSFKWLAVTLATPALAIISGFFFGAMLIRDSWILTPLYFLISTTALNVVFLAWAKHSWHRSLDGYYRFE